MSSSSRSASTVLGTPVSVENVDKLNPEQLAQCLRVAKYLQSHGVTNKALLYILNENYKNLESALGDEADRETENSVGKNMKGPRHNDEKDKTEEQVPPSALQQLREDISTDDLLTLRSQIAAYRYLSRGLDLNDVMVTAYQTPDSMVIPFGKASQVAKMHVRTPFARSISLDRLRAVREDHTKALVFARKVSLDAINEDYKKLDSMRLPHLRDTDISLNCTVEKLQYELKDKQRIAAATIRTYARYMYEQVNNKVSSDLIDLEESNLFQDPQIAPDTTSAAPLPPTILPRSTKPQNQQEYTNKDGNTLIRFMPHCDDNVWNTLESRYHPQHNMLTPHTKQLLEQQNEKTYKSAPPLTQVNWEFEYKFRSDLAKQNAIKAKQIEQDRKREERENFISAVLAHAQEVNHRAKRWRKKFKNLANSCAKYVVDLQKKKERHADKDKRARIKALKEDNMNEYLKLIKHHKNHRLRSLLNQTSAYMLQISNIIKTTRERKMREGGDSVDIEMNGADQDKDIKSEDVKSATDAMTVTIDLSQGIQEKVTTQPNILVGGTLKEYQLFGLEWMISLYNNGLNGILADEMGLGKTIQTIALLTYLIEKKSCNGPFLVVVPLSTIGNWANEFEKWAPDVNVVVYIGKREQRKHLYNTQVSERKFNVLLTTYEYTINTYDRSKLAAIEWVYIIIDEGHRMKNANSKLASTLSGKYTSKNRLILTGTPLQNNLTELWALLNFLLPTIFNSGENFNDWFNKPFESSGFQGEDGETALDEEEKLIIINRLHQVLRPFLLRRMKKEVASMLPEKIERVIKCPLSAWQSALYHQVSNRAVAAIDPKTGEYKAARLKNTLMQLRKVCNHPYLFEDDVEVEAETQYVTSEIYRASGKFELLDRILPKLLAGGHRVLMFFQMTRVMDIFEDYLRWKGLTHLRLDGSTVHTERKNILAKFNAPNSPYFIFILSTRAGGLGLNLQTADTVIIFDSDWNPQLDLQAQDRAHRIGQTMQVSVYRLICQNTVEEKILETARNKLEMDSLVIQSGRFNKKASAQERNSLIKDAISKGVDLGQVIRIPEDDEINELLARSDRELELFQKLDLERQDEEQQLWEDAGNTGPVPSRLMQEDEVPEHLLLKEHEVREIANKEFTALGKGRRKRESAEKSYQGLTDKDFEKMLELEMTPEQYLAEKKKKQEARKKQKDRRARRKKVKEEKGLADKAAANTNQGDGSDSDSQTEIENGSQSDTSQGGKRKRQSSPNYGENGRRKRQRKRNTTSADKTNKDHEKKENGSVKFSIKREADNAASIRIKDTGAPAAALKTESKKRSSKEHNGKKRKRKRRSSSSSRSSTDLELGEAVPHLLTDYLAAKPRVSIRMSPQLSDIASILVATLLSLEASDGQVMSILFQKLPSPEELPDYYQIIKSPMDFDTIQAKTAHQEYQSFSQFVSDMYLMFDNARAYNRPDSVLYSFANELQKKFEADCLAALKCILD